MTLREFLSDRFYGLLLHIVSMGALFAFLRLTGTPVGVVGIILVVWAAGLAITQAVAYRNVNNHLSELQNVLDGLDQKYLFVECMEKPKSHYERQLFKLLRRSGKSMIEAVSAAQASSREYREYIESWVHEIKVPITAAELICQNADSGLRRKLMPELLSVESHVERALFYARAESAQRDFLIRQAGLDEIVSQAIEKHRALLIQSGMRIETSGLEETVYTDSKWAAFMIGQLLQNAVRYKSEAPVIQISAKPLGQQVQLTLQDNGIGIPAHELPRIFDRGFTGSNGRVRGGSTGMGLYISKKLAAHMSVLIAAESGEGVGTAITLTFPAKVSTL